jgi:hypothetical protein
MSAKARIAVFLGLLITVAGFVLITLAWSGAAGQVLIQGQFPYLLSGGVAGLGFVMAGLALVVIQLIKLEGDRRARQLEQLIRAVHDLAARLADESEEEHMEQQWLPRPGDGQAGSTVPIWRPSP